jgi:hypothetical protein
MEEATLTRAVNQVETITTNQSARPAKVGQVIRGQTEVQTGPKSLAELTFPDETLARIGSTSRFGFSTGTRQIDLQNGTLLLQVPKNVGGATIRAAAVTAAITGTTVLTESSPSTPATAGKIIVLEGRVRVTLPGGRGGSRVLRPGEMIVVPMGANRLPRPVVVDLARLVRSSRLINGGGLRETGQIDQAIAQQQRQLQRGNLRSTPSGEIDPNNPAWSNAQQFNNLQTRTDAAPGNQPQPPAPKPQVQAPAPAPTPAPTPPPIPRPSPTPNQDYYNYD